MTKEEAASVTFNDVIDVIPDQSIDGDASETTTGPSEGTLMIRPCGAWRFEGFQTAQGYNILGMGRGALVMSNIFLSTAFIYLASDEVGCVVPDENGDLEVDEDCEEKVYGVFSPAALVTNIAVISGVLAALLMPVLGAIIDYTPHRWRVGAGTAATLILIQVVQIGTTSKTWFAMSLLQALSGFIYQVQNLAAYAYLPDVARTVGEMKVTKYLPIFTTAQFGSQLLFLIVVTAFALVSGYGDVETARFSQCFNAIVVSIAFFSGWRLLPQVPARNTLPEGKWMVLQGFAQNWATAKDINKKYKRSLRWFLVSVVFGESAAAAFTLVSVVFLSEQLDLSGGEVGVFFVVALVGMLPGGKVAKFVTSRTNPKISWCLSMLSLFVMAAIGGFSLNRDNATPFSYVWGFVVGVALGWFYPTEGMIFSMCMPEGRESELSGFFVYSSQILSWLPPLVFSLLVEADVDQGVGVVCVSGFLLLAIATMCLAAPWKEMLEEVDHSNDLTEAVLDIEKEQGSEDISKTEEALDIVKEEGPEEISKTEEVLDATDKDASTSTI